jgi:hypothetical protein
MSEVEVVLVTGERRRVRLAGPTVSFAHALDRLDEWVETEDGGWVQKKFIVEVQLVGHEGEGDETVRADG